MAANQTTCTLGCSDGGPASFCSDGLPPDDSCDGDNEMWVCDERNPAGSLPTYCRTTQETRFTEDNCAGDADGLVMDWKCADDPRKPVPTFTEPIFCDNGILAECDDENSTQPFCPGKTRDETIQNSECLLKKDAQALWVICTEPQCAPEGLPPDRCPGQDSKPTVCPEGSNVKCLNEAQDGFLDPNYCEQKAHSFQWGTDCNQGEDKFCRSGTDPDYVYHHPVICDIQPPGTLAVCSQDNMPPTCRTCDRACEMLKIQCEGDQQPVCDNQERPTVCDTGEPRICPASETLVCEAMFTMECPEDPEYCEPNENSKPKFCFDGQNVVVATCPQDGRASFCADGTSPQCPTISGPGPRPPGPGPTAVALISVAAVLFVVAVAAAAGLVWLRLRRRMAGGGSPAGAASRGVVVHTVAEEVGQDLMREFQQALTGALSERDLYPMFQDGNAAGPNQLVVVAHQVGERLYVSSILPRLQELQQRGARVVLVVMIPHNPSSAVAPRRSRNMLEDQAAAKIRSYTTGYYDLYFWDSSMRAHGMQGLNFNNMSSLVSLLDLEA